MNVKIEQKHLKDTQRNIPEKCVNENLPVPTILINKKCLRKPILEELQENWEPANDDLRTRVWVEVNICALATAYATNFEESYKLVIMILFWGKVEYTVIRCDATKQCDAYLLFQACASLTSDAHDHDIISFLFLQHAFNNIGWKHLTWGLENSNWGPYFVEVMRRWIYDAWGILNCHKRCWKSVRCLKDVFY